MVKTAKIEISQNAKIEISAHKASCIFIGYVVNSRHMAIHESVRTKAKSIECAGGTKKRNYVVFRIESFGNKTEDGIIDKKDLRIKKKSVLQEPAFTNDGAIFFPEGVGVHESNT